MTCDCTVRCGDDPWLKDGSGRATPCKNRQDLEERDRQVSDGLARITELRKTYDADTLFELLERMHTQVTSARQALLREGMQRDSLLAACKALLRDMQAVDAAGQYGLELQVSMDQAHKAIRGATPNPPGVIWMMQSPERTT